MSTLAQNSAYTLDNKPASYTEVFYPIQLNDTRFFDEGPRRVKNKTYLTSSLSGSMDTRTVDPFAQGVEITRLSRYDAGIAKIWSGEPAHRLLVTNFGQDKNFFPNPSFAEMDLFDPVRHLESQEILSTLYWNILTYPIITGDNDQLENYNFNGVIEPLTIRPIVAFFSTETPFESHAVRASMAAGNHDQLNGCDRVLSIDYFEPDKQIAGHLDMVDMMGNIPMNGFFLYEFTPIGPFSDERLIRNTPIDTDDDSELIDALSHMTGSTDDYVAYNKRSATCGWCYDNTTSDGTDSLAFGGMIY